MSLSERLRGLFRNKRGEVAETAEGARLLSGYTDKTVSRVRIPPSPPFLIAKAAGYIDVASRFFVVGETKRGASESHIHTGYILCLKGDGEAVEADIIAPDGKNDYCAACTKEQGAVRIRFSRPWTSRRIDV